MLQHLGFGFHLVSALMRAAIHVSLRVLKKRFSFFRNMCIHEMAELVEITLRIMTKNKNRSSKVNRFKVLNL